MTNIKNDFIKKLTSTLEEEKVRNELDLNIPFLIACVDQKIEECTDFMNVISTHSYDFGTYEKDSTGGYSCGSIYIYIEEPLGAENSEDEQSSYRIDFLYDCRYWGYCECEPYDEGYDENHNCCGDGCDWEAPSFRLTKERITSFSWSGKEKDYWEYENEYKKRLQIKAESNSVLKEHLNKMERQEIENEIQRLKERLMSL